MLCDNAIGSKLEDLLAPLQGETRFSQEVKQLKACGESDHVAFLDRDSKHDITLLQMIGPEEFDFFLVFSDGRLWWRRKLFLNLPLKQRGAERRLLGMDGQSLLIDLMGHL